MSENATEMEETFGRYLQDGRMTRGMLLASVAEAVCVGKDVLHKIEEEEHENLPEPVYVRGFVRGFAEAVDLNADYAVRLYDVHLAAWQRAQEELARRDRRVQWLKDQGRALAVLAFLIVCTFWGGLFLFDSPETPATPVLHGPQIPEDSPAGPVVSAEPKRLHLLIEGVEETEMKILVDGVTLHRETVKPGDVLEIEAEKKYNILIGNATGVRLQLDGAVVPVPGSTGQAVNIYIP